MSRNFGKGFELNEWRWECNQNIGKKLLSSKPQWDGQKGKRVLVYSEQGVGDVIMFASVLNDICEISSEVMLACDDRLLPLFRRSFSEKIVLVSKDQMVDESVYHYHIPIGSLPMHFRKEEHNFESAAGAYLQAEKNLTKSIRARLLEDSKSIVGISWRGGSLKNNSSRLKDIELSVLAEALSTVNCKLVSLQYGPVEADIKNLNENHGIHVEQLSDIDNYHNLDGLASLISACDYIVSVDNLTVHLAGALGVKTNVLLPIAADWRWAQEIKTSYWHSSLYLLRQQRIFNWSEPLSELQSHLE